MAVKTAVTSRGKQKKEIMVLIPLSAFHHIFLTPGNQQISCNIDMQSVQRVNESSIVDKIIEKEEVYVVDEKTEKAIGRALDDYKHGRTTLVRNDEEIDEYFQSL